MARHLLCGGGIAPQLASAPNQRLLKLALVLIAFALATATAASAQTYNYPESSPVSGGGTLNWTLSEQMGYCGSEYQDVTDTFENFSYTPATGSATGLSGSIYYLYGCDAGWGNVQGGWNGPGGGDNELDLAYTYCTVAFDAYIGGGGNPTLDCPPLTPSTFDPLFKVVSLLYSPPGNQSSQGYSSGTTNGTTTTIASSFSFSEELSFSSGIKNVLDGSASWGFSLGTGNNSAFTQTWADATNYASDDNKNSSYNPTGSNALNHLLDTFEVWLNPQVIVSEAGSTPVSYSASSQPVTFDDEQTYLADVLPIPAMSMEAQPAGVTALNPSGAAGVSGVLVDDLIPQAYLQENGTYIYEPGMGAICKNNSLYQQQLTANLAGNLNPGICTQTNQCGCTPADFSTVMEQDALLNYDSGTNTANPGNGTGTPLAVDAAGEGTCGYDQPAGYTIPPGSDCRYVIVPQSGTNIPLVQPLNGAQGLTYTQSDSTVSSFTTTASKGYNTGFSFQVGDLLSSLKTQDTWTWTDTEGTGTSTGGTNSMSLTLQTSTANCSENVNLYEDTIYHSYVFQAPAICP